MTDLIFKAHVSQQDQSVNFEHDLIDAPGKLEARYVRRDDDQVIVYLSSQSGCSQACRMCHLTATGQNKLIDIDRDSYLQQAKVVFEHYKTKAPAQLAHFNFMSRGEPLANSHLLDDAGNILTDLTFLAHDYGLKAKHLVSTILPKSMGDRTLVSVFGHSPVLPEIYYSLYSMDPKFRRKWLPKAFTAEHGLDLLKEWQDWTGMIPKIHFAFIEGENDSFENVREMGQAIVSRGLKVNLNIVRFNPANDKYREPDEVRILALASNLVDIIEPERWQIVPRVGLDVQASCGTFLN